MLIRLRKFVFRFSVVKCSIHKSKTDYIKIGKTNRLRFHPDPNAQGWPSG